MLYEYFQTSFITRIPSAILAVGFVLSSMLAFACGMILDTVAGTHRKQYEIELNRISERISGGQ